MPIVYVLKCPKTLQVRYVGEGGATRPFDHVRKVRKGNQTSSPRLTKWIQKLLNEGKEPLIEIVQTDISKQEALQIEANLIKQYGRKGLDEGGTVLNVAEEGRHYDKSGSNNPFFGRRHSAETKAKMAEARRGKDRGENFRKKMSEIAKARPPMSEETRMKKRASMLARWEIKRREATEPAVSHLEP